MGNEAPPGGDENGAPVIASVCEVGGDNGCVVFSEHVGTKWEGRDCLLYTSPSPRDLSTSRMPSSA